MAASDTALHTGVTLVRCAPSSKCHLADDLSSKREQGLQRRGKPLQPVLNQALARRPFGENGLTNKMFLGDVTFAKLVALLN
jgi:hypothetical protein